MKKHVTRHYVVVARNNDGKTIFLKQFKEVLEVPFTENVFHAVRVEIDDEKECDECKEKVAHWVKTKPWGDRVQDIEMVIQTGTFTYK